MKWYYAVTAIICIFVAGLNFEVWLNKKIVTSFWVAVFGLVVGAIMIFFHVYKSGR